jgi:uncharacterized protein (TIGR02147 family)
MRNHRAIFRIVNVADKGHPVPDIFKYTDYRRFLKDSYEDLRTHEKKYSYRYIAQEAHLNSSGFLGDVFAGNRNLTQSQAINLATVLHLKKDERGYFLNLVGFNQAKHLEDKNHH